MKLLLSLSLCSLISLSSMAQDGLPRVEDFCGLLSYERITPAEAKLLNKTRLMSYVITHKVNTNGNEKDRRGIVMERSRNQGKLAVILENHDYDESPAPSVCVSAIVSDRKHLLKIHNVLDVK